MQQPHNENIYNAVVVLFRTLLAAVVGVRTYVRTYGAGGGARSGLPGYTLLQCLVCHQMLSRLKVRGANISSSTTSSRQRVYQVGYFCVWCSSSAEVRFIRRTRDPLRIRSPVPLDYREMVQQHVVIFQVILLLIVIILPEGREVKVDVDAFLSCCLGRAYHSSVLAALALDCAHILALYPLPSCCAIMLAAASSMHMTYVQ